MTTTTAIVDYAVRLHRANTEQLGFIPRSRLEEYAERGLIITAREGGDECGFLVLSPGVGNARILQACVETDLRLLGHGRALVDQAVAIAEQARSPGLGLRCRVSNDAIRFWQALGFDHAATVPGGRRRGADIACMWRPVCGDLLHPAMTEHRLPGVQTRLAV